MPSGDAVLLSGVVSEAAPFDKAVRPVAPRPVAPRPVAPRARPDSSLANRLQRAFLRGDADAATAEAAPRLSVTVRGEGGRYSRAQAAFVLDSFFREHPPVRVSLSTAGVAEGARSLMGRYVAEGDLAFRLGVRLRLKGQRWEVIGIEIEPSAPENGGDA